MTWTEKSACLRDRYACLVGPLILLTGVSANSHSPSAPMLTGEAGLLLILLTVNRMAWLVSKHSKAPANPNNRYPPTRA